jgi:hypothetical protein
MQEVIRYASVESFQSVAIIPLLLLPVFGIIWLFDRKKSGQPSVVGEPGAVIGQGKS